MRNCPGDRKIGSLLPMRTGWTARVAACQNGTKQQIFDVFARVFDGSSGTVCRICRNFLEIEMELRYYETRSV